MALFGEGEGFGIAGTEEGQGGELEVKVLFTTGALRGRGGGGRQGKQKSCGWNRIFVTEGRKVTGREREKKKKERRRRLSSLGPSFE